MTIQEKIKADVKTAMLAKETQTRDILRVVIGEFNRIGKEVSDTEATATIKKMVANAKKRKTELSDNWKGNGNPMYKELDLEYAKKLLLEGLTNVQIAEKLKVSIPTFINKFKKEYSITPKNWKNENTKNK